MLNKFFALIGIMAFAVSVNAQSLKYTADLTTIDDEDELVVSLQVPKMDKDVVMFYFPMTIPGTYATLDYGKYIDDLVARDANGKKLRVKRKGKNGFRIKDATRLATITYEVEDTWDSGVRKNKVFEPAGTNFEVGKNFMFNSAGIFGFFEGMDKMPVEATVTLPEGFYGETAMKNEVIGNKQKFMAESYHQLVDCPIMFSKPDSVQFVVGGADVTISSYNPLVSNTSQLIYEEIAPSMKAIEEFTGVLPVDKYSYLVYIKDFSEIMAMVQSGNLGFFKRIGLIIKFSGQGFGALEHNNSSVYFLPDFGDSSYINTMRDVAIHEFMHIITPLNLHSTKIGNFDFINPEMSKHLWLYEGVTEYFAGLIQLRGGILEFDEYIKSHVTPKMKASMTFPRDMSFTDMSENVLEKPYSKHYGQVYQRGAIMGLLLDFEIIRLTDGEKNLRDVVLTLAAKYGANKSFEEDQIFQDFVNEVDPELMDFFKNYMSGTTPLDYEGGFAKVGLNYIEKRVVKQPENPLKTEDIRTRDLSPLGYYLVSKVGKKAKYGFEEGDKVFVAPFRKALGLDTKEYPVEGSTVNIEVERKGEKMNVPVKVVYKDVTLNMLIEKNEEASQLQKMNFEKWSGLKF